MTPILNSTPPTVIHMSGPSISMVSTLIHYRDHHAVIKAIEKCSLQATFGPEIISTGDLLPKKPDALDVTVKAVKANHAITTDPTNKRLPLKRPLLPSDRTHTNTSSLPVDLSRKNIDVAPDRVTNGDGGPLISTKQRGSIHSVWSINGSNMPAISDFEKNSALFVQSSFLRQVSWGQEVRIYARTP